METAHVYQSRLYPLDRSARPDSWGTGGVFGTATRPVACAQNVFIQLTYKCRKEFTSLNYRLVYRQPTSGGTPCSGTYLDFKNCWIRCLTLAGAR